MQLDNEELVHEVSIENTSAKNITATIFGYNKFFNHANFGNDMHTLLQCVDPFETYGGQIKKSKDKPFKVSHVEIVCDKHFYGRLVNYMEDANGDYRETGYRLRFDDYGDGFLTAIVKYEDACIDGNSHLRVSDVPANMKLKMKIYKKK